MHLSKVTWSITRTIRTQVEKAKKHIFKRIYHCHFNTNPRPLSGIRKRKHAIRNTACPAMLTITLAYLPKNKSRSKSPDNLAKDWPCTIRFTGEHNHTTLGAAALIHRPISESTKNEIIQYFQRGHSVASAYHTFCFKKMEEFGDDYNALSADRSIFPSKSDFQNLCAKHFKENNGELTGSDMFEKLKENLAKIDKLAFKIGHIRDDYALSFCTPLMKTASECLSQKAEILFVDATNNSNAQKQKLYFFGTQSTLGVIPLGCIISTGQKEQLFDVALINLIEVSLKNTSPKIILTNDDMAEREILQRYWPSAKILYRSFHVLRAVWKWLSIADNNIPKTHRQTCYKMFKNILHSTTKEELDIKIGEFNSECKFENFKKYVNEKIERDIGSWCLYYRTCYITGGSDTSSIGEVMVRLFKDIPFEGKKTYNLVQLADFITNDYENYFRQRLLDICFDKITKNSISRLCPNTENVCLSQIKQLEEMEFCFHDNEGKEVYFVDLDVGICSCPIGFSGKFCKHQSSIILNLHIENVFSNLSDGDRKLYLEIAMGSKQPKESYMPLEMSGDSEDDCEMNTADSNDQTEPVDMLQLDSTDSLDASNNTSRVDFSEIERVDSMWSDFITKFNEDVSTGLRDDPSRFVPAIQSCITSYQEYINSSYSLAGSLFTLFKPSEQRCCLNRNSKNAEKVGGRSTSVVKRQTFRNGKRKLQSEACKKSHKKDK